MSISTSKTVILFATSVKEERERFIEIIRRRHLVYELVEPLDVREADQILASRDIDIIVTDLEFSDGAFADWLVLWPRPFILMAYYGEEERLDMLIKDESSSYIMRDSAYRHLGALPIMIRKVLNVRESLNRQNAHLQISERRYMDLVSSLPDIVYTLDGDGHFIYINDSVSQLGYRPHELLGKHFSFIIDEIDVPSVSRNMVLPAFEGVSTGPEAAPKLFDERRTGSRMTKNLEIRLRPNRDADDITTSAIVDAYGEVSCVGYTLPEYDGGTIGTVGIIRDITLRKQAEFKLLESLRSKEILLKEIHHRVKNNLQIISSLLNLQASSLQEEEAQAVFLNCQSQIQAMAMVHEQLYHSDNLQSIDLGAYFEALVHYLARMFDPSMRNISIAVDCSGIKLGTELAIPLALILNELLASLFRQTSNDRNSVSILLKRTGSELYRLSVNTIISSFPKDFRLEHPQSTGSLLVKALADQIGATVTSETGQGDTLVFEFPGLVSV
jgi:PAS domain S-box-containing protein